MSDRLEQLKKLSEQVRRTQELHKELFPVLSERARIAEELARHDPTHGLMAAIKEQLAPINALQEQLAALVLGPQKWAIDLGAAMAETARLSKPFFEEIERQRLAIQPFWALLVKRQKDCERIEAAGWLPHYTTPSELLEVGNLDTATLDAAIADHYASQWQTVKDEFIQRLSSYAIDDQAKETFLAALGMHEAGFYRGTTRLLFPEIERVVRVELHGNTMHPITSLKDLREQAGGLAPGEIEPAGAYGMRLFNRLASHLYENVKTKEAVEKAASDPVPNRHAALHGFVAYDTAKSSVNMLIMADFILQVVVAVKRNAALPSQGSGQPAAAP